MKLLTGSLKQIMNVSIFAFYRHNTWEPEENILDVRLIELYEESQKGGDVTARRPRRRDTRYSVNNLFIFAIHVRKIIYM